MWGLQVEPGPRPEEVTLNLQGPNTQTISVHDAHMLPEMTAVGLRACWQNRVLMRQPEQTRPTRYAVKRELAHHALLMVLGRRPPRRCRSRYWARHSRASR